MRLLIFFSFDPHDQDDEVDLEMGKGRTGDMSGVGLSASRVDENMRVGV